MVRKFERRAEEWTDRYNPFNSWKALCHSRNFEAILERKPLPPIVVNFDLTNQCNYNCHFCMFGGRKRADISGETFRSNNASLPTGYALGLPKIWKRWGVKAECLAGGGEPSLHPDCLPHIIESAKQGIEVGFVTNGFKVDNQEWWTNLALNCKFVGFSVDAGNPKDYSKTKGVPMAYFERVMDNIFQLAKTKESVGGKCQIGFKFILDEMNYKSIYEAAKIASEIGVNHFQFRPAIDPNYAFFEDKLDMVWDQITAAQGLETKDFKVFGVQHKFNKDLSKKHKFNVCRATMLTTTWAADGKVYMCTDTRGNPWAYLCDHYPNPRKVIEYWGSKEHFEKVDKIDFNNRCDRCTLTAYNEFFEQIFIEDKMDRNLI